jgi:hypothetical protein
MIKSRRMKWVGHVACMREVRNTVFWLENLYGRDHFQGLGVNGNVILKWTLGKQWEGVVWMHLTHDREQ